MQHESRHHFLIGPVAACLSRMYLLRHKLSKAKPTEISDQVRITLEKDLVLLQQKLELLQHRIETDLKNNPTSENLEV